MGTDANDQPREYRARDAGAADGPLWGARSVAPDETVAEAGSEQQRAPDVIDPPTLADDRAQWWAEPAPSALSAPAGPGLQTGPVPSLPDGTVAGPVWADAGDGGIPDIDPAPVPVIELVDVTKIYRTGSLDVAALRGVDLQIHAGEYVAIMGPSGSGKSTLMHIIGCLDVATAGVFRLAGENVGEMDEVDLAEIRNRRIGFVFQQFNLLPSLTAWRNVELPLTYARVPRDVRRARAMEALDRVGLADRVDHRPGELSGGQQQRVAVARALVTDPALILADEPTGNLDSVASEDVLALFDELHEQQRTIVLITHEMEVAERAHRIIRVRDGMILSEGSHQESVEGGGGAHAAEARAGIGVVPAVSG